MAADTLNDEAALVRKVLQDLSHYKTALLNYKTSLHDARQTYFISLINIFHPILASSSLPYPPLPPPSNTFKDIATHFKHKIDNIWDEIATVHFFPQSTLYYLPPHLTLSDFDPVTSEDLTRLFSNTHFTTCASVCWITSHQNYSCHPLTLF